MIGNLGPMEIVVILGVVVLLFGGKKIPELARGVGKGIKEFKRAQLEIDELPEKTETKRSESDSEVKESKS